MKKLILLSLILFLLGFSLVGCLGGGNNYSPERNEINALLDKLETAYMNRNLSQAMDCFADTITVIKSNSTPTAYNQTVYSLEVSAFFLIPYTTFEFKNRDINVTSFTNATVTFLQSYTFVVVVPENKKFTLVKTDGAWKITVNQTL